MSPEVFSAKKHGAQSPKKSTDSSGSRTVRHPHGTAHISTNISSDHKKIHHRKPEEYSEVLAAERPSKNGWTSYAPKPVHLSFETQQQDEQVLLFLRQHPIVNLPWILIAIAMFAAPFLVSPIFDRFLSLPPMLVVVATIGWFLLTLGFVLERILLWLFNAFIITDERIIDIDFHSIIFKEFNYAQIDKIQDVNVKSGGVLYSLLDVGSVFVQTAAEVPEFVFDNISHPNRVAKLLNELLIEEQREVFEGRVR